MFLFEIITFASELYGQQVAPDFPIIHIDQSVQSLSDLQGEVVYISFWASWCRPCLHNFKKYETIRASLQNKGVVLLNVNIDDNRTLWQNSLQDQNILGTNVWASDFEQIQDDYEIFNIPQYEIINRKGQLVYLPDDPDRSIIDAFDAWLKD